MTATAAHTHCLRCGRPLHSADSRRTGLGSHCRRIVRTARRTADLAGFKPEQITAATELIEDGGIVPLRANRIYLAVSTDGLSIHRTAVTGQCSCPAGIKSRRCYHTAAARIFATAA
jgi:hypothetical protein